MFPSIEVNIKYLHSVYTGNKLQYATEQSVGLDLRACFQEDSADIYPGDRLAIPAGIAVQIKTSGIAGFVFSRSGLGTKKGLVVSQGVGVIDPDYRGEVIVSLLNTSKEVRNLSQGQRIAQLIFLPVYQANLNPVEHLDDTSRGEGGFGHTGEE